MKAILDQVGIEALEFTVAADIKMCKYVRLFKNCVRHSLRETFEKISRMYLDPKTETDNLDIEHTK